MIIYQVHPTMKSPLARGGSGAFTLIELLLVIATIGILAALLMPVLDQAKVRARRVQCVNNLRETGIAFHLFANDHGEKVPTQVSTNNGGSLEFVAAGYQTQGVFYFSYQHFLPLAGTLLTPKLLACPADLERLPATNFTQFNNWNLSYAIGLPADAVNPRAILAADRNLPACHRQPPGPTIAYLYVTNIPPPPYWSVGLHKGKGNILFADGHAEESYDAIFPSETTVAEDLVYPDVKISGISTNSAQPNGSADPNNSPSPNQSVPPAAAGSREPSAPPNLSAPSPAKVSVADQPPTNNLKPIPVATNAVVATDFDSGMSAFNRQLVKIFQLVFGWVYLLLLLLFLIWLFLKLRREWRWRQQRRQKR